MFLLSKKFHHSPMSLIVDHFAQLNTRLDSMNSRLISYGEQYGMINSQIRNLEANQERQIRDSCAPYSVPLRGYHFDSNPDGFPCQ